MKKTVIFAVLVLGIYGFIFAQDKLQTGGEFYSDQRFLYDGGTWFWNENRLDLNFERKTGNSAFYAGSSETRRLDPGKPLWISRFFTIST